MKMTKITIINQKFKRAIILLFSVSKTFVFSYELIYKQNVEKNFKTSEKRSDLFS